MKKSLYLILLLTIAILLFSCSDDSTGPSPNEKGHLSAKFNGEYWVPKTNFDPLYNPASHYGTLLHFSYLTGRFSVASPRDSFDNIFRFQLYGISKSSNQEVSFYIDSVQGKGIYIISYLFGAENKNLIYSNSNMKTGILNITEINIDTLHYFNSFESIWYVEIKNTSYVKGTFEISLEKEGSTLEITDGMFYLENKGYTN